MTKAKPTLTEKVSAMDDAKFERWMKRNGYTGMAAVKLAANRRAHLKANLQDGGAA